MNKELIENQFGSSILDEFISEDAKNDYSSATAAEEISAKAGTERLDAYKTDEFRFEAHKEQNRHEEQETLVREKGKNVRCALKYTTLCLTMLAISVLPLMIKSKTSD